MAKNDNRYGLGMLEAIGLCLDDFLIALQAKKVGGKFIRINRSRVPLVWQLALQPTSASARDRADNYNWSYYDTLNIEMADDCFLIFTTYAKVRVFYSDYDWKESLSSYIEDWRHSRNGFEKHWLVSYH